jgi:hypothetical protein
MYNLNDQSALFSCQVGDILVEVAGTQVMPGRSTQNNQHITMQFVKSLCVGPVGTLLHLRVLAAKGTRLLDVSLERRFVAHEAQTKTARCCIHSPYTSPSLHSFPASKVLFPACRIVSHIPSPTVQNLSVLTQPRPSRDFAHAPSNGMFSTYVQLLMAISYPAFSLNVAWMISPFLTTLEIEVSGQLTTLNVAPSQNKRPQNQ